MNTTPPKRTLATLLHLLVLGTVGSAVLGILFGLLTAGLTTIVFLGIGIFFLIALVYSMFGVAWVETERVSGLYELDIPRLTLRRQPEPGFASWLKTLWKQTIDARMWRAFGNFSVGVLFGFVTLSMVSLVFDFTRLITGTLNMAATPAMVLTAVLTVVFGVAIAILMSRLFRTVSLAMMSHGAREAELLEQVHVTTQQREGAVRAADVERTRIERDLHDGVQPRLVSVAMTLGLASQKIDEDPQAAKALVTEAHTSVKSAITELRQLARGIYASVLDDRGLDAALSAVAARSHIPVLLDVRVDRPDGKRCSRQAEAAVYFAIAESLTNAAKHSRASECRVTVRIHDDAGSMKLWARVEDNGIGGARVTPGGGLDGISNRIIAAGGTVALASPNGGPTSLEVSVPCAS